MKNNPFSEENIHRWAVKANEEQRNLVEQNKSMRDWRHQITTPEQLRWAVEHGWPVEYDYIRGRLIETTLVANMTKSDSIACIVFGPVGDVLWQEDDIKPTLSDEEIYIVPKTVDELSEGDDYSTYAYIEGTKRVELLIPYLPENIFPKQENV